MSEFAPTPGTTSFTLTVRNMEIKHLEAVLSIEAGAYTNPWRKRDFEYAMKKSEGYSFILMSDEHIVGYTVGFLVSHEYHLANITIRSELQRRGLGKWMLTWLINKLGELPVHAVTLEVRASNHVAIALYLGEKFQTVAIQNNYYSRPRENALVMMKAIRGEFSEWVSSIDLGHPKTGKVLDNTGTSSYH